MTIQEMQEKQGMQVKAVHVTINNPLEKGYTDEKIDQLIVSLKPIFAAYCHEIGANGTPHVHIYLLFRTSRRLRTIRKRFPKSHVEKAYGSPEDNVQYLRKDGKFAGTSKSETSVEGSYREFGEIPQNGFLNGTDMAEVVELLKEGYSIAEIISEYPKYTLRVNQLEAARQAFLADLNKKKLRAVEVVYKYGATGTGKTRSIYKEFAPEQICRITSYGKNGTKFDAYTSEDVLVFEEYASQIPLEELLIYLDIYPVNLPARYTDRVGCYTHIIFTSNLPLEAQYITEQHQKPETYKALLRRINYIEHFNSDGTVERYMLNEVFKPEKDKNDEEENDE